MLGHPCALGGFFAALSMSLLLDTGLLFDTGLRVGTGPGPLGGFFAALRMGLRVGAGLLARSHPGLRMGLLVGAGLMLRSFIKLQNSNIGIDPTGVLTFRVGMPAPQFKEEEASRFFKELLPKLSQIPGVESAAATTSLPAMGNVGNNAIRLGGEPPITEAQKTRQGHVVMITPGFLQTARITLLRGRDLTAADNETSQRVVLIELDGPRERQVVATIATV